MPILGARQRKKVATGNGYNNLGCATEDAWRGRASGATVDIRGRRGGIDLAAPGAGPIAHKIEALLAERGISKAELGRRIGVSQQAMQKWWNGTAVPTLETRRLIARALGLPLSELLNEAEEQAKAESDKAIEQYIASPMGADLTQEQRDHLRLSIVWIDAHRPMQPREVHAAAELIRLRVRGDLTPPMNPKGNPKGRRINR